MQTIKNSQYSPGLGDGKIAYLDINGDGLTDYVRINTSTFTIGVVLQDANDEFYHSGGIDSSAPHPDWVGTGDFNGDDTAGRAAFYDLRYATAPITDGTWDTATRVLGELGPKPSGAAESFTATGLDPSRTYYFALKVRDDQGNLSARSNVAPGTTAGAVTVFGDNVENGTNGWTATGLWHPSTSRATSPATSWYYGREATHTYDTGAANSGTLTSPVIDLRGTTHPVLIYREWRHVEDINTADSARVQITTNPYHQWVTASQSELSTSLDPLNWQGRVSALGWSLTLQSPGNTPQWVSRALDLSAYAGKRVQIRFAFDTVDDAFNDFEGWYVDDVNVFDAVQPASAGGSTTAAGGGSAAASAIGPAPIGGGLCPPRRVAPPGVPGVPGTRWGSPRPGNASTSLAFSRVTGASRTVKAGRQRPRRSVLVPKEPCPR